jgi:hypothetical protein
MASLPLFLSLWLHYLSFYRYGFITSLSIAMASLPSPLRISCSCLYLLSVQDVKRRHTPAWPLRISL